MGQMLSNEVDNFLEEFDERFWFANAASDDDTVVGATCQSLGYSRFRRFVEWNEMLVGG